jgi:hypothetical protein
MSVEVETYDGELEPKLIAEPSADLLASGDPDLEDAEFDEDEDEEDEEEEDDAADVDGD